MEDAVARANLCNNSVPRVELDHRAHLDFLAGIGIAALTGLVLVGNALRRRGS